MIVILAFLALYIATFVISLKKAARNAIFIGSCVLLPLLALITFFIFFGIRSELCIWIPFFLAVIPFFMINFDKNKVLQTFKKAGICFLVFALTYFYTANMNNDAYLGHFETVIFLLQYFIIFYIFANGKKGFILGSVFSGISAFLLSQIKYGGGGMFNLNFEVLWMALLNLGMVFLLLVYVLLRNFENKWHRS